DHWEVLNRSVHTAASLQTIEYKVIALSLVCTLHFLVYLLGPLGAASLQTIEYKVIALSLVCTLHFLVYLLGPLGGTYTTCNTAASLQTIEYKVIALSLVCTLHFLVYLLGPLGGHSLETSLHTTLPSLPARTTGRYLTYLSIRQRLQMVEYKVLALRLICTPHFLVYLLGPLGVVRRCDETCRVMAEERGQLLRVATLLSTSLSLVLSNNYFLVLFAIAFLLFTEVQVCINESTLGVTVTLEFQLSSSHSLTV
ncbi:hypothetical protein J6590_104235, partial [Homalodisca vitripennis]